MTTFESGLKKTTHPDNTQVVKNFIWIDVIFKFMLSCQSS